MAIFNEAYVELLLEKKTTEEYHISDFKKEFNFVPSKDDPNIGTITDGQGKKYKVKIDLKDKNMGADTYDKDSLIVLDKKFFNLKGSNKNERMKALLQHEIGHQNLHNWNPDNKTVDKKNRSMESIKDDAIKTIKAADGRDMTNASDDRIFKIADVDAKGYFKTLGSPEEQKKRRNADLEKAKKYEKEGHTTAQEFEAVRFAANKTSKEALKKGLRNLNKMNRKSYYKDSEDNHKSYSKKDVEKDFHKFNSDAKVDYDQRSKALKDKDLRDAKTYK